MHPQPSCSCLSPPKARLEPAESHKGCRTILIPTWALSLISQEKKGEKIQLESSVRMEPAATKPSHSPGLTHPQSPKKLLMGKEIIFITGKQAYGYCRNDIITPLCQFKQYLGNSFVLYYLKLQCGSLFKSALVRVSECVCVDVAMLMFI